MLARRRETDVPYPLDVNTESMKSETMADNVDDGFTSL
jgi:hypothetical protein